MTDEEYEAESERLAKAKKGYDLNRTICTAVIIYLVYSMYKDNGFKTTPWYILLILSVIAVAVLGIFIFDCLRIKEINAKIKKLEQRDPETLEVEKSE